MFDINCLSIAYIESLLLWIPLLCYIVLVRPVQSKVFFFLPMVLSAVTLVYECYMTFIWSPTVTAPIRVDILFILVLLGVIDGVSGCTFLLKGMAIKNNFKNRVALTALGVLCISIPILAVTGLILSFSKSQELSSNNELGRRFRFEASFRDSIAQKRFYGELDSVLNPWSGYYVTYDAASWYKHLIVNVDCNIWLYRTEQNSFLLEKGIAHQSLGNPNIFSGEVHSNVGGKYKFSLERIDRDNFILRIQTNYPDTNKWHLYGSEIRFRKSLPPRFPIAAPQVDQVRFLGAFSSKYNVSGKNFYVIQVWLWKSHGTVWGRFLRNWFVHGELRNFFWTEAAEAKCSDNCKTLELSTPSNTYPIVLTKTPDDRYIASGPGFGAGVVLNRGEIVPGYIFDLAPLESETENRKWLDAVHSVEDAEWNVPDN